MSLKTAATAVFQNAYAPYSKFKVGAAIRAASGVIYSGCNVENVSYPEGTCAEAGAIAAMVAAGETELTEVYVIADSPMPVSPCGGCRQKLAEFGKGHVAVIMGHHRRRGTGDDPGRAAAGRLQHRPYEKELIR